MSAASPVLRRLMAWHTARYLLFWLPVFQLYLSGTVGLADALVLEGIYFASVFALEVPTGWIADRLGRRHAMIASPIAWGLGAVAFASADGFWGLALGQLGFAFGMSTGSGADTAWLYDHLRDTGEAADHEAWEARIASRRLVAMAVGALLGAALGTFDLRLPYLAFATACAVAAGLAWTLPESSHDAVAPSPRAAAATWARLLRTDPVLRWGLLAEVALLMLVHIPYELYQPWLRGALGTEDLAITTSGALAAGAALVGAWAAGQVGPLRHHLSAEAVMVLSLATLTGICGLMAWAQAPWLLPVVLLRSAPEALATPALRARLHPRLPSSLRATWWSIQSLAGRAAFAVVLWTGAVWAGGTGSDAVARLFAGAAMLSAVLTALVAWARAPSEPVSG